MAFDRSKYREALIKRTKESIEQGDYGINLKYFKADGDFSLWNPAPTKGKPHLIDIIPFFSGNNFPLPIDRRGKIEEGDLCYVMRVQVHTNIGPSKMMIVCPLKNYDLKCPICEDVDRRNARGDEYKTFNHLTIKQRCVYNILCWDNDEEREKGVQIYEGPYKYTEKEFKLLGVSARTNEVIPFADPDIGASISFNVGNDEYRTPSGFKLEKREGYVITDDILDQAFKLDELLLVKSYQDISEIFHRSVQEDEDSSNNPANYENSDTSSEKNSKLRRTETNSSYNCPSSIGVFGEDFDKLDNCGECEYYIPCGDFKKKRIETSSSGGRRRG